MTTVGMWIHAYLTISVVHSRVRTRNPIWGELIALVASFPIFALWMLIERSLP